MQERDAMFTENRIMSYEILSSLSALTFLYLNQNPYCQEIFHGKP